MQTVVNSIRERVLNREILSGTFLNLGSNITVEIAGRSGLDWLLIDTEHGAGDHETLVHQLQAAGATPAAPIVRIAFNETPRFKRALDLGASGIMVPWVSSVEEAQQAVAAMQFPPRGVRGVAKFNRASGFGADFEDYFEHAHEQLTGVIQIERKEAVDCIEDIAAVPGVDVLFVGPLDLSVSLGIREQFDDPAFIEARDKVAQAAKAAGKAAGILLWNADRLEEYISAGYTFIAVGSDGGAVGLGMKTFASAFDRFRG